MTQVVFAGKVLTLAPEGGFLLEDISDAGTVGTSAWKLDGSFVTTHPDGGHIFVEGPRSFGMPARKAMRDTSPDAEANAEALVAALGVRMLTNGEAEADYRAAGVGVHNVTAEEAARKRGRPPLGEKAMTSTERNKRRMQRLKAAEAAQVGDRIEQLDRIAESVMAGAVQASTTEKLAVWLVYRPAVLADWAADVTESGAWTRLDDAQRAWVRARRPALAVRVGVAP